LIVIDTPFDESMKNNFFSFGMLNSDLALLTINHVHHTYLAAQRRSRIGQRKSDTGDCTPQIQNRAKQRRHKEKEFEHHVEMNE